jgi:hypothetical protein
MWLSIKSVVKMKTTSKFSETSVTAQVTPILGDHLGRNWAPHFPHGGYDVGLTVGYKRAPGGEMQMGSRLMGTIWVYRMGPTSKPIIGPMWKITFGSQMRNE